MATVTEAVKETLVGTTINVEPSQEVRVTFDRHSIRDDVSGENYMTEKEFVNAIAPLHENYVSRRCDPFCGYDRRIWHRGLSTSSWSVLVRSIKYVGNNMASSFRSQITGKRDELIWTTGRLLRTYWLSPTRSTSSRFVFLTRREQALSSMMISKSFIISIRATQPFPLIGTANGRRCILAERNIVMIWPILNFLRCFVVCKGREYDRPFTYSTRTKMVT